MFSAILSFLGGSFVRMVWGEASAWITQAREHKREIERMRVQAELEDRQHARAMESMRLAKELELEVVRVQGDKAIELAEVEGWAKSVERGQQPSGIWIVDLWNGTIRPAAATIALWLWVRHLYVANWAMAGRDWDMVCAILGWFFADRTMSKKSK